MKEIHDKTEKRLLDYHKFFKGQTEVFKKEADMFFNAVQVRYRTARRVRGG